MNFEEFFKDVVSKIGAKAAFDISRDVRLKALENLLVEKGIFTEEELKGKEKDGLKRMAEKIKKMPPPPSTN